MSQFAKTAVNQVKRVPQRGAYDQATIYPIIDEALICHVGIVQEERPFVIPTLIARDGDEILLHGASSSRLMRHLGAGHEACVTVTHVDGLVLARSVFHHSVNYRSVVLFGNGRLVEAPAAKMDALARFTEKLIPGRWEDARQPNPTELKATAVVAIPIDLASAKIRTGPPSDDEEDYQLDIWAGLLPIRQQFLPPIPDPRLREQIPLPTYLQTMIEPKEQEAT